MNCLIRWTPTWSSWKRRLTISNLLNEIFRAAHTIKGTSSFLGFDQVTNLTHKMEDILNKLRKAEMDVTPEIMDLLLESLDILKVLIAAMFTNRTAKQIDLDRYYRSPDRGTAKGSPRSRRGALRPRSCGRRPLADLRRRADYGD